MVFFDYIFTSSSVIDALQLAVYAIQNKYFVELELTTIPS